MVSCDAVWYGGTKWCAVMTLWCDVMAVCGVCDVNGVMSCGVRELP